MLTVGPIERFPNSRKLVSYWGLNPRENSSGGRQRLGSISKQGNTMMRWLLVEAAQTAARLDPQLRRTYQRLKKQRTSGVAKVAVARRLAVRLFWMLRTRHNYTQLVHMSGSPSSAVVPPQAGSNSLIGRRASPHEAGRSNGESWCPPPVMVKTRSGIA